jgi:hypothetical protein
MYLLFTSGTTRKGALAFLRFLLAALGGFYIPGTLLPSSRQGDRHPHKQGAIVSARVTGQLEKVPMLWDQYLKFYTSIIPVSLKKEKEPDMVACACNLSTREAEAEGLQDEV